MPQLTLVKAHVVAGFGTRYQFDPAHPEKDPTYSAWITAADQHVLEQVTVKVPINAVHRALPCYADEAVSAYLYGAIGHLTQELKRQERHHRR